MREWIRWHQPELIGIIVGTLVMVAVILVMMTIDKNEKRNFDAFMKACTADRKDYECYAMWRSIQANVMPVPILIPIR